MSYSVKGSTILTNITTFSGTDVQTTGGSGILWSIGSVSVPANGIYLFSGTYATNATAAVAACYFIISTSSSLAGTQGLSGSNFPTGAVYYSTLHYNSGGACDGVGISYVANPSTTTIYYLYGSAMGNGGQYNIQVTRIG